MHIGIDCRLPYYRLGGISQYVLHLIPALAKLDQTNQYTVFQSRKEAKSHVPDAPNFRRRNLWTPCHHQWEKWALGAELRPHRLALLHSPDFIPPAWGAKKYVITVHDLNFLYYPDYLTAESRRYYLEQIGWAVQKADHISADSHHTRQDLLERLNVPPEKVTTVHLAANPVYEQPVSAAQLEAILAEYNLPRGFLLFVGTLEPRKNIPTLLKAYARLRPHLADIPLVLVGGKGWLYEEIFATIEELGLRPHVRHLQGVSDEKLAGLYAAASLLALPSHYEGFGLPPLEAMHQGCPVITSDRGSLPEIVGVAGLLLDADEVDAWAEAMNRVVHDSALRQQMTQAGYVQAQKFKWENAAARTLAIYRGESGGLRDWRLRD